jgi:hypothetical protein
LARPVVPGGACANKYGPVGTDDSPVVVFMSVGFDAGPPPEATDWNGISSG